MLNLKGMFPSFGNITDDTLPIKKQYCTKLEIIFCRLRILKLDKIDDVILSQLHQLALLKSSSLMEATSARDLIPVSLAVSTALLGLTFNSSLPPSMCASIQQEHSSLLLSHSASLVSDFIVLSSLLKTITDILFAYGHVL
jgi:hypothetical protein